MDSNYGPQSREKFRPLQRARKPSTPESSHGSNSARPLLPIENCGTPRTPLSFSLHEASPTEQRGSGKARNVIQHQSSPSIPSATPRIRSKLTLGTSPRAKLSEWNDRASPIASTSHFNDSTSNNPFLAKIDSLNTIASSHADFEQGKTQNVTFTGNGFDSRGAVKGTGETVTRREKENVLVCVRWAISRADGGTVADSMVS